LSENQDIARIQEQIITLFKNDENHKADMKDTNIRLETTVRELTQKIDQFANRLPNWASILIGCLMGVIGYLAKN